MSNYCENDYISNQQKEDFFLRIEYCKRHFEEFSSEEEFNKLISIIHDLEKEYELIDAREWNGRWFNSIRAWKVERVGAQGPVAPDAPFPPMNAAPAAPVDFAATDEKDDLPF